MEPIRRVSINLLILTALLSICGANQGKVENFFEQFGYLPKNGTGDRSHEIPPELMERAITMFQKFNGLRVTGILDATTREKMFQPRCGVKDIMGDAAAFRKVSKWRKTNLTWSLKDFSKTLRLSRRQQLETIKKALSHWSSVTPLVFTEVPSGADIVIRFATGDHGDGNSFDGRGNVLAHAFFPSNGDTHFDDSEEWTINSIRGTNLEIVAAHEFGHALGLAHSHIKSALMAPYYQGYNPFFKLHIDDIFGIQSLYGRKMTPPPPTTTRRPPSGNGYCGQKYKQINAVIRVVNKVDYVFVDRTKVISSITGRKLQVTSLFRNGPTRVDAALYSAETNKVYLTYGDKYWAFSVNGHGTRFTLEKGYPVRLTNTRAGRMDALMGFDMSIIHYKSVRVFILKGQYFWELVPRYHHVTQGRGYLTSRYFKNIPKRISTVLTVGNTLYFLSYNKFYKMQLPSRTVSSKGLGLKDVLLTCRWTR
ncbi:matrix metalloproteinase-19-like [Argonauta hians]